MLAKSWLLSSAILTFLSQSPNLSSFKLDLSSCMCLACRIGECKWVQINCQFALLMSWLNTLCMPTSTYSRQPTVGLCKLFASSVLTTQKPWSSGRKVAFGTSLWVKTTLFIAASREIIIIALSHPRDRCFARSHSTLRALSAAPRAFTTWWARALGFLSWITSNFVTFLQVIR